jgi:hypothetical protein
MNRLDNYLKTKIVFYFRAVPYAKNALEGVKK